MAKSLINIYVLSALLIQSLICASTPARITFGSRQSILKTTSPPLILERGKIGTETFGLIGEEVFKEIIHAGNSQTFDLDLFCKIRTGMNLLEEGGIDAVFFKKSRTGITFLACEIKTQIADVFLRRGKEKRANLHRSEGDQMSPAWLEPRIYGGKNSAHKETSCGFGGKVLLKKLNEALLIATIRKDSEAIDIIEKAISAFNFKADGILSFKSFVVKIQPTRTKDHYWIIQLDFKRTDEASYDAYRPSKDELYRGRVEAGPTQKSRFISNLFGF